MKEEVVVYRWDIIVRINELLIKKYNIQVQQRTIVISNLNIKYYVGIGNKREENYEDQGLRSNAGVPSRIKGWQALRYIKNTVNKSTTETL